MAKRAFMLTEWASPDTVFMLLAGKIKTKNLVSG